MANGTDDFGSYEAISRDWSTSPRCTSLRTEIRWYDARMDGQLD